MTKKSRFRIAECWIREQLADTSSHRSMFQRAAEIYAEMQLAMAAEGARGDQSVRMAGTFGGVIKRWKAGLVASITQDIIKTLEIDVSRERIRSLQLDIFGRAQASKDLRNYAVSRRNGGGRAAPMPEIPEPLKDSAYAFYLDHEDDLKEAVQRQARPSVSQSPPC